MALMKAVIRNAQLGSTDFHVLVVVRYIWYRYSDLCKHTHAHTPTPTETHIHMLAHTHLHNNIDVHGTPVTHVCLVNTHIHADNQTSMSEQLASGPLLETYHSTRGNVLNIWYVLACVGQWRGAPIEQMLKRQLSSPTVHLSSLTSFLLSFTAHFHSSATINHITMPSLPLYVLISVCQ